MSGPSELDVATASGVPIEFVRRVVANGLLVPGPDGSFAPDAHAMVRTVGALQQAGFEPELVGRAVAEGFLSLEFLDPFSVREPDYAGRTYGELVASRGEAGRSLGAMYAAFGLPEPDAATRLSREEEAVVGEFLDIWTGLSPAPDAPVRGARIVGEGMRRIVESYLDAWDELAATGAPAEPRTTISAPGGALSVRMGALLPRLLGWLERRHAEGSIQTRIVQSFEDGLERLGEAPARVRRQPSIAFVDLAGYTRLTVEAGDELAVRSAVRLQELSAVVADRHGGRLVKLLGDGVMFRFPDSTSAVRAVAELLPQLRSEGLPAGHAGLASGPLIDRDGDVYGRTVILAARLATEAGPNELIVTADVIESVAAEFDFVAAGEASLRGFSQPVPTWRLKHGAVSPPPA
jgi:adenylate cyclase